MSLECLAGPVMEDGFPILILDMDVGEEERKERELERILVETRPAVVGVTSLSHNFPGALMVFKKAKEVDPGVLTVLGGIHGTVLYHSIMRENEEIDVVVRGEGEEVLRDIVRAVYCGVSLDDIPGVSLRRDRKVVHTPDRHPTMDLSDYPPPVFDLLPNKDYRTRSLSSSRGCPHQCLFCSIRNLYGGRVRWEPIGKIIYEIEVLKELGAKRILFTDDNFTSDVGRVKEICRGILANDIERGVEFYIQGRADDFCRRPLMASWLREAGFRAVYMGAEAGSQEILDRYGKDIRLEEIRQAVALCVAQDLTPVVSFILAGPWDTATTVSATLSFARSLFENGAEIAYTEALVPFPGTEIQRKLQKDGHWHEQEGIYYFSSYTGFDMERFFRLCDLARDLSRIIYADDPRYASRRVYYEMSLLEALLAGRVPEAYIKYRRERGPEHSLSGIDVVLEEFIPKASCFFES